MYYNPVKIALPHLGFALLFALLLALRGAAAQEPKPAAPPPPPPVVQKALQELREGDVPGALALLEPLRKQAGAPPDALSLLGLLYLQAGRAQDALDVLGPLADSETAGAAVLERAGRASLALGQTAKAEGYLERAVAKSPQSVAARELGMLRGSQNRPVDAYKLLRPWALAHPEDGPARLAAAFAALELDRPPEAEELLAGLPADGPRVRLLRGELFLLKGEPREAINILKPLVESGPPALQADARRSLAEAHVLVGESREAIALLQGQVGDDPERALLLGKAHYQAGEPDKAVAVLEPAARKLASPAESQRPLAADLALELGRALIGLSRWPEAIASLEQAVALAPEKLQAWQSLSQAQLAAGRREDATRSMERFRALQSAAKDHSTQTRDADQSLKDPTGTSLRKAANLAAQGRGDEALKLLRQEIELTPDPRPRRALVETLLKLNRREEAVREAEAFLRATPEDAELLRLREAARAGGKRSPE